MSRSLKWLPEAVSDLVRLREFIQVHHPDAAKRAASRIRENIKKLLEFPFFGRPVLDLDNPQLRDLFIPFGKAGYWVRYAVSDDEIIIIKIWHGRENPLI